MPQYGNLIYVAACMLHQCDLALQILEVSGGDLINPIHYWVTPLPCLLLPRLDHLVRAFNIKVVFRAIPSRMSADVSGEGFRRYREQIGYGLVQLTEYL